MDSFVTAATAVTPFLVYMLYGYLTRRAHVTDEAFLDRLNKVVFRCFFPFLSFYNIYNIDPALEFRFSFVFFCAGLVLVLIALLLMIVPRVIRDKKQAGSYIQAVYRSNCVLYALPLAHNVYGQDGASHAAMMVALIVPLFNVSAVLILEYFGSQEHVSWKSLARDVITNPIIIGVVIGILFYALKIRLPRALDAPVNALNLLTTPLAMFVLGGSLHFSQTKRYKKLLISGLSLRLVLIPAGALCAAVAAGFSPVERFVIFACFSTPSAAASYAMASAMGCDAELAGQFVVLGTVLSVFTLFLWIFFIGSAGLL